MTKVTCKELEKMGFEHCGIANLYWSGTYLKSKNAVTMKNAITIRLEDTTLATMRKVYEKPVTAAQTAVEGYFEIRRRSLQELAGKFDPNELNAIADNLNGTMLVTDFQASPEILWQHLQDGNTYEGLFQKWNINPVSFKTKILALTAAQTYFLQDAINLWWYREPGAEKDLATLPELFK